MADDAGRTRTAVVTAPVTPQSSAMTPSRFPRCDAVATATVMDSSNRVAGMAPRPKPSGRRLTFLEAPAHLVGEARDLGPAPPFTKS